MSRKQRWTWLASTLALAAGFALLFAAYGVSANKKHVKHFGTFRTVYDAIDYFDPAQAYTGQSWSFMYHVYETLVTYPHVAGKAGGRLVPGLAQSMPKITRGGRQYTFVLRKGLKYSNGKPVRATDFKYTIKRLYLSNSQGVGFYENIVGAKKFENTLKGDIPGIVANNAKRTVTFKLVAPRGDFLSIMALLFASPVPAGTPNSDQSSNNLPSTGPYHIIDYTQNVGGTLVRNKFFKPTKNIPKGNPDKITVKLERLNRLPLSDKVNAQWAAVDKAVMKQAFWAPYVNRVFTDYFSSRVNMKCYVNQPIYHFDYSRICPK